MQGLITGLAYVAPIGMQNIYIINMTISKSKYALFSVISTIIMDISLALAAFWGMGIIVEKHIFIRLILLLFGGILVLKIGIDLFKTKVNMDYTLSQEQSYLKVLSQVFSVTWLNPQALIDGAILLGGAKALYPQNQSMYFVIGMNLASVLWFFTLYLLCSLAKNFLSEKFLNYINKISSIIMIIMAIRLFYRFILEIGQIL